MKRMFFVIAMVVIASLAMAEDDSYDLAQKAKENAAKFKNKSVTNIVVTNIVVTEEVATNNTENAEDSYDLAQKAKENAEKFNDTNKQVNIIIINQNNNNQNNDQKVENNQSVKQNNDQDAVQDNKQDAKQTVTENESVVVENNGDSYDLAQKAKENAKKFKKEKKLQKENKEEGLDLSFLGISKREGDYEVVPFSFSFFPLPSAKKTVHHLHLNLGVGYCDRLEGIAAGIVTIVGEDASPLMYSILNIIGNDVNGFVGSASCNFVGHNASGFIASAACNIIGYDADGFMPTTVNIIGHNASGFFPSVVNIIGHDADGFFPSVVNIVGHDANGFMGSVVNIVGNRFDGFQAGIVNIAGKMKGFQVGLVNIDGEIDGDALALVGIYGKGGKSGLQLWYDELGIANLAFRHGSKTMYNIYTVGVHNSGKVMTFGLGLGLSFNFGPILLNVDTIGSTMYKTDDFTYGSRNFLGRTRAYVGLNLFDVIKGFVGVSYNMMLQFDEEERFNINSSISEVKSYQNGKFSEWAGVFLGIEL